MWCFVNILLMSSLFVRFRGYCIDICASAEINMHVCFRVFFLKFWLVFQKKRLSFVLAILCISNQYYLQLLVTITCVLKPSSYYYYIICMYFKYILCHEKPRLTRISLQTLIIMTHLLTRRLVTVCVHTPRHTHLPTPSPYTYMHSYAHTHTHTYTHTYTKKNILTQTHAHSLVVTILSGSLMCILCMCVAGMSSLFVWGDGAQGWFVCVHHHTTTPPTTSVMWMHPTTHCGSIFKLLLLNLTVKTTTKILKSPLVTRAYYKFSKILFLNAK